MILFEAFNTFFVMFIGHLLGNIRLVELFTPEAEFTKMCFYTWLKADTYYNLVFAYVDNQLMRDSTHIFVNSYLIFLVIS